ncbi:hypothetical protein [Clostridium haemolyticum]|uniref:Transcriptional regulator n=1 Tax=Clostridium haemolyticum NCTC 9693 TaxID=1443114 RepID=A0ABR4TBC6_CLOHA|nr:hypothetical protein [Clostridium haemolyticum]KEI14324.1 transcriptional regulator [Clostridium haemolyticum NCTC 9693]KGM98625.1 transcriptional regulator [Clostridium haemolyticum NCTC 8350]
MLTNKNDITILRRLYKDKKINKLQSYTIKDLTEALDNKWSSMKIRATLNEFLKNNLVELGFKAGRSNTYFITECGINALKNLLKEEFSLSKGEE